MIEGLKDGRFAIYTKMHHSLIDGVSALKLMQRALSDDPDDTEIRAPWSCAKPKRKSAPPSSRLSSLMHTAGSLAALAPSTVSLARAALFEQQLTLPFGAPRTMLNVKIGGARRCAAQSWSVDRDQERQERGGGDAQRRRPGDVFGRLALLPARAGRAAGHAAVGDGPGEPAPGGRGRRRRQPGRSASCATWPPTSRIPPSGWRPSSESMYKNKTVFSQLPRIQALALSAVNMGSLAMTAVPGMGDVDVAALQPHHLERAGTP